MKEVYDILNRLNIKYEEMTHKAVYTSEAAMFITKELKGTGVKNLFLKSKKTYYLVMIPEDKKANIKEIRKFLGESSLSFAGEEDLKEILGLFPGSVTPFGIINDNDNKVTLVIDEELENKQVLFHPNTNTKTLKIDYLDLLKFINYEKHKYVVLKKGNDYEQ